MRAIVYTPVALLVGGLVALAAFPNLAEYAAPLIPETTAKAVYPFNGTGMSPGGSCCASQQSRACMLTKSAGSCPMGEFSCCSAPSQTVVDAESPVNVELTDEPETTAEAVAADALAAANNALVSESKAN